jgi:hypothetical protein
MASHYSYLMASELTTLFVVNIKHVEEFTVDRLEAIQEM